MINSADPDPNWMSQLVARCFSARHDLDSVALAIANCDPLWTGYWKISLRDGSARSTPDEYRGSARVHAFSVSICPAFAATNLQTDLHSEKEINKRDGACIAHRPGPVSALRFLTASSMPIEIGHG